MSRESSRWSLERGTPETLQDGYMSCRFCGGIGTKDRQVLVIRTSNGYKSAKVLKTCVCSDCAKGLLEVLLADLAAQKL